MLPADRAALLQHLAKHQMAWVGVAQFGEGGAMVDHQRAYLHLSVLGGLALLLGVEAGRVARSCARRPRLTEGFIDAAAA